MAGGGIIMKGSVSQKTVIVTAYADCITIIAKAKRVWNKPFGDYVLWQVGGLEIHHKGTKCIKNKNQQEENKIL